MALFSERNGYVRPSDVIIRERMTTEIINAICSCYDDLNSSSLNYEYYYMEEYLWRYFLNRRKSQFLAANGTYNYIVIDYILNSNNPWYKKLDLIEESLNYFVNNKFYNCSSLLTEELNKEFARLCFAYRIINNKIVEVTSEEEIGTIETALKCGDSIQTHLSKSLELLAKKPEGDYRNSIKESISAVEAFTREITGEKVLNLGKLEEAGIILPSTLRNAFNNLYGYTNDKTTGIRHALMDEANAPGAEEAIFMLVSCSAFINYLTKKKSC